MEISKDRIKQLIKEEYQKVLEGDDLDVMVQGYGNLGSDPMIAIKSAKRNLDNFLQSNTYDFQNPFEVVTKMAEGTLESDADKLQMVIDLLRPLSGNNEIEVALAKLSAVLEHRLQVNEEKSEKK